MSWIRTLASLKLGVGLLVALVVALATGTIVESIQGTEAAGRLVYHASWFRLLLVAGIIAGSVRAASSWGRYWGWDPKEVWSLIAFLAYMAILHARGQQIGRFGIAAGAGFLAARRNRSRYGSLTRLPV